MNYLKVKERKRYHMEGDSDETHRRVPAVYDVPVEGLHLVVGDFDATRRRQERKAVLVAFVKKKLCKNHFLNRTVNPLLHEFFFSSVFEI